MSRILLAEDNPGDVILVQLALEEHGIKHDLQVAKNGAEALTLIAQLERGADSVPCPDLLLLDINLPKVDGFQVLTVLRQNAVCAETPVIIVTSSDTQEDRARMGRLGISHYFCKPADLSGFLQLGAVVRKILQDISEVS